MTITTVTPSSDIITRTAELLAVDPLMEVRFPIARGNEISSMHGYQLMSALKSLLPWIENSLVVQINTIAGIRQGDGRIITHADSKLQLRVPVSKAASLYNLAGTRLSIGQGSVALNCPTMQPIMPKPNLYCRVLSMNMGYKGIPPADLFLEELAHRLERIEVKGVPYLDLKDNKPRSHFLRMKNKKIACGYSVKVCGLSDEDSIKLQQFSVGGRKTMGGGWFG